ncbi:hypothetical protein BH09BAC2_BH09BAC2_24140 [soil metagenome]
MTLFTPFSRMCKHNTLIYIFVSLLVLFAVTEKTTAQSAGFNTSYAVFSANGGGDIYYCMFSNTTCGGNPGLDGAFLGSFTAGTSTLIFKGAEHNVYKCGGANITATNINYRIYLTGNAPGSFIPVSIGYLLGNPNGCGGEDQQWKDITKNINVLQGLAAGNYTIEIYSDAPSTVGTQYLSNLSTNYKATFTVTAPLPVTLTGFRAYQKSNGINVEWKVAQQINVSSYSVEKSASGIQFNKAAIVPASAVAAYSWYDADPLNGANFYRLKITDINGAVTYSNIIKVIISSAKAAVNVFPNPVSGNTLTLQLVNIAAGNYQVMINDLAGRFIYTTTLQHQGGSSSQTLSINNISSGSYLLNVAGNHVRIVVE